MVKFVVGLLAGGIHLLGFVVQVNLTLSIFKAHLTLIATMSSIASNVAVALYGLYHPDYVVARWHIFIGYIIITWIACGIVLFANRALPMINNIGLAFILGGVL